MHSREYLMKSAEGRCSSGPRMFIIISTHEDQVSLMSVWEIYSHMCGHLQGITSQNYTK